MANKKKKILPHNLWLIKNGYSGLVACKYACPELFAHIEQEYRGGLNLAENIKLAEKLVKENNNVLPSYTWLVDNGYRGLPISMRKNPEEFKHIEQERLRTALNEWVRIAEELAKNNNKVLPSYTWLCKNGYGALTLMMQRSMKEFSHIEQENGRKILEEWVKIAEELAKNNNGVLPAPYKLKNAGYEPLYTMIKSHSLSFSHIKQEKTLGNSLEKWVEIAEELAKNNNGVLPNSAWLQKNDNAGVCRSMSKYPEFFSHLEQERKIKTLNESIKLAEKLAKDNDGILPNPAWLRKNKYTALVGAMCLHPKKFTHIPQKKLTKTIDEWVKVAEKVAKENNGKLPTSAWMGKNNLSGLYHWIQKCPEVFSHLLQDRGIKTFKEKREILEQITKNNDGKLPSHTALKKEGMGCIRHWMARNPEEFSHIVQEKNTTTIEESMRMAKKIAAENNGILPPLTSLPQTLKSAIEKHRKIFKGMKQVNGRTRKIRTL